MTPEELLALIEGGETLVVEFKSEERAGFPDGELAKAAACLANNRGGETSWLLLGVEDDGRISGARPRHKSGRTDLALVQAAVANKTRPPIYARAQLIDMGGAEVLAIEVPAGRQPTSTADGLFQHRVTGSDGKPACVPFQYHEMQAQQADLQLLDYTVQRVRDIDADALDPLEFERYRRAIRENRGASDEVLIGLEDVELAKALGAVALDGDKEAVTVLGLLLFGRPEALAAALPAHEIAFQVLSGGSVEVNDHFRWPLLRAMDEIEGRFRARNREREITVGMRRIGVPDYSPRAFREAVANALTHRDYTRLGGVLVQWRDEEIEISNPGGFPAGVRLDNLLVTPPHPRNPMLADAFKRAGLVERTARGIDTIFEQQVRNGRPPPSYERSSEDDVVLQLPAGESNLEFVRMVAEEAHEQRPLGFNELMFLNQLHLRRQMTISEAAGVVQRSQNEARATLERLVEQGLIEGRGGGKGRIWHLSAGTYRRLGLRSGYVRRRGFEPIQQEQMVMQYVAEHGRITRVEAAELCRIGPRQATRLLARLRDRGDLAMHGRKRGAWYGRP